MMMKVRRRIVFALVALALALVLAGCGREPKPTVMVAPTPTLAPATAEPAPAPTETLAPVVADTAEIDTAEIDTASGQLPAETDAFLHDYLQNLVHRPGEPPSRYAPGAVLLVDTPAGRFMEAGGVSSLEDGTPLDVDDRFEIGSITKLFTAAALLRLHEEGVLSLDDTVGVWLPEQAAQFPFGAEMTLRQLASHTAGLGEYERDLYPMPRILNDAAMLEQSYTPAELAGWVAENKAPLFPPGAPGQWMYSNTGYILLGMAMEAATGQSMEEIHRTYIFEPLGMESAILLNSIPEAGQVVNGYNAMTGDYANVSRWNPSGAWAAGALAMNAADLSRFGNALINDELFAHEETMSEMTRFVSTGQQRGFTDYGLGLSRLTEGVWGHGGGTPGFGTLLLLLPEAGVTAVYLGNNGAFNINPNELLDVVERTTAGTQRATE